MCIICIKKQGVKKPTDEQINNMADNNPDGFGMMWSDGKKLHWLKTMDVKDILKQNKKITDDMPAVYHFRIATHGSVQKNNCHPFIDKEMGLGFAHNGILSIKNEGDWTDSETAFRRIIIPNIKSYGIGNELDKAIESIIGSSKFVLLNADKTLVHWGAYKEFNGLLFSNETYSYSRKSLYDDYCYAKGYSFARKKSKKSRKNENISCGDAIAIDNAMNDLYSDMSYYDKHELESLNSDDIMDMYGEWYPELTKKDWSDIWTEVKLDLIFEMQEMRDNY